MTDISPIKVFITGASSGIGEALARYYAHSNAILGLVARRQEKLDSLIASLPVKAVGYAVDVTDPAALASAATDFINRFGAPDIVIANAGVSVGTLTECAEDLRAFEQVMRTNVLGMVASFQPFIAAMRERQRGRLVGIASVAGVRGLPGAGAYSASKAAVIAYLESLRVELRHSGIKVVTVSPGYVATPMTAVNSYRMPFLLSADDAARRIARRIDDGVPFSVVPWQMAIVARLMRWLPPVIFDYMASKAGRKPRGLPL